MRAVRLSVLTSALVIAALLVAGTAAGTAALPVARASSETVEIAQSTGGSLSVEIFDMFNVPYRGWWDFRGVYGDLPIGADCFSFENIPGGPDSPNPEGTGACDKTPTGYSGETWITYPFIDALAWVGDRRDIQIYAPYRMNMVGVDQPGATLAQPVYLPVFNPSAGPGSALRLVWDFTYLTKAETEATDLLCGSSAAFGYDGFVARNLFTVTMDLQESKRIFGVEAPTDDPAEAAAWWAGSELVKIGGQLIPVPRVDPDCSFKGVVEDRWEDFMVAQGGDALVMGSYDLYSSFEWFYQPFMTNLYPESIDPVTGETTILIDHVAFGPEILFARWFHWGPALYLLNAESYPHNAMGWWKWELGWFEDAHFDTTIGATDQDFGLSTVMQYHLTAFANPGPDGIFHSSTVTSNDDLASWQWMSVLTDYVYGGGVSPAHTVSELDPYIGLTYLYARPGTVWYGTQYQYDLVPAEWDLEAGDTVVIRAPNSLSPDNGVIKFIDPYSPLASDVTRLVLLPSTVELSQVGPFLPAGSSVSDSDGDGLADTLTLVGPIDWGLPGQPLWGAPVVELTTKARTPCTGGADLVGRSAWPEHHHFVVSKDEDGMQSLFAKVANLNPTACNAGAVFTIRDSLGNVVATIPSAADWIPAGQLAVFEGVWTTPVPGKYVVEARAVFDADSDGAVDTLGTRARFFSFAVVP